MARYRGSRCKLSRRLKTDLELKQKSLQEVSPKRHNLKPGQHAHKQTARLSDYGLQLQQKQILRYYYGVSENQLLRYYKEAVRRKGATGEILLQLLEARLDNVIYRMGFATTRAEARQIVKHRFVLVDGRVADIPSYSVKPGQRIEIREKAKNHLRIQAAIEAAKARPDCPWIDINVQSYSGTLNSWPERNYLPSFYNEQLVVEFYSK